MKKLRGLQTYKSIAFSYEQIPLTHFIIYRFPFSFLNTLPPVIFWEKVCDFPCIPCRWNPVTEKTGWYLLHWCRCDTVGRFFYHFIGGVRCQNGKKTVLIAVLHHIAFSVNGNGKSVNEENGTDGIWLSVSIAKLLAFFVTVSFWISCRKEYHYA